MDRNRNNRIKKSSIIKFEPSCEAYINLAYDKLEHNNLFGAIVMLRRALDIEPQNAEAILATAEVLTEMQRYEEALWELQKLVYNGNDISHEVVSALAYCYLGMGEIQAASGALAIATASIDEISEEAYDLYEAAEYCENYLRNEQIEKHRIENRPIRDLAEKEIADYVSKSVKLEEEGNFEELIELLEPSIKKYPDEFALRLKLVLACYCTHEYERGLKHIEEIPAKDQDRLETLCISALLYHGIGDEDKVELYCGMIDSKTLSDPNDCTRAYTVMIELDKFDSAFKYAESAYRKCPFDKNVIGNYAGAACKCGDIELAISLYERQLVINPNDYIARYYRDLCKNNANNIAFNNAISNPGYSLPIPELIRRQAKLNEFLDLYLNDPMTSEKSRLEEVFDMAHWVLAARNEEQIFPYIVLIAMFGRNKMEYFLQYILLVPYFDAMVKDLALKILASGQNAPKSMLVCMDGRLQSAYVSSSSSEEDENFSDNESFDDEDGSFDNEGFCKEYKIEVPDSYKKLIEKVQCVLLEYGLTVVLKGIDDVIDFVEKSFKELGDLNDEQIEALAAVFEYELAYKHENPSASVSQFIAEKGVSFQSYIEAKLQIDSCKKE